MKTYFWSCISKLYLPEQDIDFYIELIIEIDEMKEKNVIFKLLTEHPVFIQLFQSTLSYIFLNFHIKSLFYVFDDKSKTEIYKKFLHKYHNILYQWLETRGFSYPFAENMMINPVLTKSEKHENTLNFLIFLEKNAVRKDFKKLSNTMLFFDKTNEFLSNQQPKIDTYEFLFNYLYQAQCKTLKNIEFIKDINERIIWSYQFLSIFQVFNEKIKKQEKHIFEHFLDIYRKFVKIMKNTLKSSFWNEINTNREKIYSQGVVFNMYFQKIKGFLYQGGHNEILLWSYILFIKVKI